MFRLQRKRMHQFWTCSYASALPMTEIHCRNFGAAPSTSDRSYYEILGVNSKASTAEIRSAYLALTKKYHPDVSKDDKSAHQRFTEINEAYSVLSKPETRREYDAKLFSSSRQTDAREDEFAQRQGQRQQGDPVEEMYKRYFDELYRRRYGRRPDRHDFHGQREQNPFRDFRWDPPIWPDGSMRDQKAKAPGPGLQFSFVGNILRLYFTFLFLFIISSAIVSFITEDPRHPRRPYPGGEYGQFDPKYEERWKNIVINEKRKDVEDSTRQKTRKDDESG